MASSTLYYSPCAACKFLRRKCLADCVFAPYFPPEEPQKFISVHKIFGASNVAKLLNEVLPHQREDAVISLAYEAEARIRDPVYGCVGVISILQSQVHKLQKELDLAKAHLFRYKFNDISSSYLGSGRSNIGIINGFEFGIGGLFSAQPPHPHVFPVQPMGMDPLVWNDISANSMYINGEKEGYGQSNI